MGQTNKALANLDSLTGLANRRCFLFDLEADPSACAIAGTMIGLCQDLGVDRIIEGVETRAQAEILNGLGCRIIQGCHFFKTIECH